MEDHFHRKNLPDSPQYFYNFLAKVGDWSVEDVRDRLTFLPLDARGADFFRFWKLSLSQIVLYW